MIIFLSGDNNLNILLNQQEHIENIFKGYKEAGSMQGTIVDFTLIKTNLYVLYQSSIIILDISTLLNAQSSLQDPRPKLIDQISLT